MGLLLGALKIFLIVGCIRIAVEAEEWKVPATVYAFGYGVLFLLDGEYDLKDFAQFAVAVLLGCGVFFLLERLGGIAWTAVVSVGTLMLLVV